MTGATCLIQHAIHNHISIASRLDVLLPQLAEIAAAVCTALSQGRNIYLFGNGGSAADAQHFAAELVGRYRRDRPALPALALTTDTSALTCIANDYNFTQVFARQVSALAREGDIVIGISTSGESENVMQGLRIARQCGAIAIALTGIAGGQCGEAAEYLLAVPSDETARIQEMHILLLHALADCIDSWAAFNDNSPKF